MTADVQCIYIFMTARMTESSEKTESVSVQEGLRKPKVLLLTMSKLNKAAALCRAIMGNKDVTTAR